MIEFNKQDVQMIQDALDYIKYGTYLDGPYLENGLQQILAKMRELQGKNNEI